MTFEELVDTVKRGMEAHPICDDAAMDAKTIVRYWVMASLPKTPEAVQAVMESKPELWNATPWKHIDTITDLVHGAIQKDICKELGVKLDVFDAPENRPVDDDDNDYA